MKILKTIGLAMYLLAGGLSGTASIIGPAVIDGGGVDNAYELTCITPTSVSPMLGEVSTWYLYAVHTGEIKLQVFRPVAGGYQLIGENPITIGSSGLNTIDVAPSDRIPVQPGDVLGFRYNDGTSLADKIVSFYCSDSGLAYHTWPSTDVSIGSVIPSASMTTQGRVYSLAAGITAVPEPSTYLAGIPALGMLGIFAWRNRK